LLLPEYGVDPDISWWILSGMTEVSVSSLEARQRKLAENANLALASGQFDYVLEACAQVLKATPGCLSVRRMQRATQLMRIRTKYRVTLMLQGWTKLALFRLRLRKVDSAERLAAAGKILTANPFSSPALNLVAEAGKTLGLRETVIFALEAVREIQPRDRANLLALGTAYLAASHPDEALSVAEEILADRPHDPRGQDLRRDATIAQAVRNGNWESRASFREKLRRDNESGAPETLMPPTAAYSRNSL